VTGKGFSDLVRESFSLRMTAFVLLTLLVANAGIIFSEFIGIAAASELFGVSRYVSVPLAAVLVWLLVVRGSYSRVEKIFLVLSLAFFAYVGAAFLAHPDWHQVLVETVHPQLHLDAGYLSLLIALIGTTISPYMQLYVQSSVVEKGVTPAEYRLHASSTSSSAPCSRDRRRLHHRRHGGHPPSAWPARRHRGGRGAGPGADRRPLCRVLFALGLLGASLLAAGVLPLATTY